MAFQKNNRYWKNLELPGKQPKYNAETLLAKFKEYMDDNDARYWEKEDFIKSGPGAGDAVKMKIQNPPSLSGFTAYAGITLDTFRNYGKIDAEHLAVTSAIREVIITIQVEGASVNIWNANIVARLAGLVDKKEVELKTEWSEEERKDKIKEILEAAGIKAQ